MIRGAQVAYNTFTDSTQDILDNLVGLTLAPDSRQPNSDGPGDGIAGEARPIQ